MYETCSCQPTYTGGQLEALAIQMLMQLSQQDGLPFRYEGFYTVQTIERKTWDARVWSFKTNISTIQNECTGHMYKSLQRYLHTWFCTVLFRHKLDQVEFLYSVPGSFSMKIWVALLT
jgi:hypothetical protein